jgi:hypothetical protein
VQGLKYYDNKSILAMRATTKFKRVLETKRATVILNDDLEFEITLVDIVTGQTDKFKHTSFTLLMDACLGR